MNGEYACGKLGFGKTGCGASLGTILRVNNMYIYTYISVTIFAVLVQHLTCA